ncbi:hypothetical protein Tco_1266957, partial [Tanacetum coccineum]
MMVQDQEEVGEEYKAVNEEIDDCLERAATTTTSLDAKRDRGNINKTQSKATPNEPSSLGTSLGGGPRRQETIGDTIAQTRSENVSKHSNDPLLTKVLALETIKTTQAMEITSLKRKVKRLEKKGGSRTHGIKKLYKVGLSRRVESSDEEGLVHDLVGDEVVVKSEVAVKAASTIPVSAATTTTTIITDYKITLAKALAELKSAKLPTTTGATTITAASARPKAKGIVIHEQEQAPTPTVSSQQPSQLNVQDKGKGKMVEPEPVKKLSKKDQLMLDEELAFELQAGEEEERLAREKAQQIEVNIAWDDVQARVEADYQLSLFEAGAEVEIAQESSSKKADTKLEQESIKKPKLDEDKETTELQRLIEVVPDKEEVAIDAIPLATKPPSIVEYKIHTEGKKTYYQIIRADGSSKMPEEGYERVLWGDLKTMFDPHVEDQVWRNQQDYRVLDWKIYDSCGVHSLRMQHMHIHMLVEKRYPLTPATITDMLNKKLQCDHFSEMLSMKKLEILKENIKFRGGLLGLKDFMMILKLLLL